MAESVVLVINCIVKGYHECPFEVRHNETFFAHKKRGRRGNAFKVLNDRGQLGHLQPELVEPLWPLSLNADILVCVTGPPMDDPKGRWRRGGGINVPVRVEVKVREQKARDVKRHLELCGIRARVLIEPEIKADQEKGSSGLKDHVEDADLVNDLKFN